MRKTLASCLIALMAVSAPSFAAQNYYGQGLIEPMAHHRHVRLVVDDGGEDVVGLDRNGQAFALAQRVVRLLGSSRLGQQHGGEGVDECQVAFVARGMKCRRRLGEVVAHDPRVADLLVAEGQLVVRQPDRA